MHEHRNGPRPRLDDVAGERAYTSAVSALSGDSRLSSAPLCILIASGTFHPDAGGPPTYLLTLGRELGARGHRIRVVTYGDEPRARRRYPHPVTRVPRGLPVPSRLALFAREVYRQGRHADLLYVNDYGLPAMLANLALRKPVAMKIVGDFAWEYSVRHNLVPADESIDAFQTRRYGSTVEAVRLLQATYARRADAVVVPSPYVGDLVTGWGVDHARIRVVYNAVADPTVGLGEDRATARTALGLDRDAEVILAVARLTPWKGIDTLIRALPTIRATCPNAILVVVGDGPDRARLQGLA
ncbi:MAG: glycosyltransferase family 4 protein, partial [Chloroflexota bacterium]|nr:glycosyltransferase family 4 protein [Chloroflexota bacterium]